MFSKEFQVKTVSYIWKKKLIKWPRKAQLSIFFSVDRGRIFCCKLFFLLCFCSLKVYFSQQLVLVKYLIHNFKLFELFKKKFQVSNLKQNYVGQ
jgi:hypothetical protein